MNERMDRLVASWGPKSHKFGAVTTEDGRTIPLKDLHGIEKGWAVSVAKIDRYRVAVISRVSLIMSSFPTASNPGYHTDFGEVAQLRQMMNHTINAKSQQVADALEEHVDQKLGSRLVDMERRLSHFEEVNKGLVVMTETENAQAMLGRIDEKFQALKAAGFPQLEERFSILEASLESLRPTGPTEGSKNTAEFEDLYAVVHAMRDSLNDLSSRSYAADGEPFVVIREGLWTRMEDVERTVGALGDTCATIESIQSECESLARNAVTAREEASKIGSATAALFNLMESTQSILAENQQAISTLNTTTSANSTSINSRFRALSMKVNEVEGA